MNLYLRSMLCSVILHTSHPLKPIICFESFIFISRQLTRSYQVKRQKIYLTDLPSLWCSFNWFWSIFLSQPLIPVNINTAMTRHGDPLAKLFQTKFIKIDPESHFYLVRKFFFPIRNLSGFLVTDQRRKPYMLQQADSDCRTSDCSCYLSF